MIGQGFKNEVEETEFLLSHALKLPFVGFESEKESFLTRFSAAKVTTSEKKNILDILNKRISSRIPAAYIHNRAVFGEYVFYVDERTIIPRSRNPVFL